MCRALAADQSCRFGRPATSGFVFSRLRISNSHSTLTTCMPSISGLPGESSSENRKKHFLVNPDYCALFFSLLFPSTYRQRQEPSLKLKCSLVQYTQIQKTNNISQSNFPVPWGIGVGKSRSCAHLEEAGSKCTRKCKRSNKDWRVDQRLGQEIDLKNNCNTSLRVQRQNLSEKTKIEARLQQYEMKTVLNAI